MGCFSGCFWAVLTYNWVEVSGMFFNLNTGVRAIDEDLPESATGQR